MVKPPISNLIDVENLGLRPAYQPRFLTRQDSSDEDSMATSLTPSTDSNASYYEIASEPSATTPENWSVQLDHANQVIDGPEDESQTPSRRSPSYSDKLRERAMPPGLYQTARSSEAEGGRREGRDSKDQASRKRGVFKRMPARHWWSLVPAAQQIFVCEDCQGARTEASPLELSPQHQPSRPRTSCRS